MLVVIVTFFLSLFVIRSISVMVRRRGALRLLAELFLCGVIAETSAILSILKNLVRLPICYEVFLNI